MAKDIRLPQLGQTMEEGTIVTILIKENDQVKKGDVIFEVETDKATLEMESPADGFVKKILVAQGQTVPVDSPIAILGDKDEDVGQSFIDSLGVPASSIEQPASSIEHQASSIEHPAPASANVVRLPQLGQTMEEGTIVTILIKENDQVKKGDVILEVETDKATLEMESPAEGFVKKILVKQSQTIPVNSPLVILAGKDGTISQSFIDSLGVTDAAAPARPAPATSAPVEPTPIPAKTGRIFASPRAKTVAAQLGVDLSMVAPAQGAVRIVEADVRKAAAAPPAAAAAKLPEPAYKLGERIKLNRLQKITGRKMLQSKLEIPCFYLSVNADVTEMVKLRTRLNKAGGIKISFNDFIIRAVASALRQFPVMTGQLDGDYIQLAGSIDIGLAISVDEGLVAPLVKDADRKTVAQIAAYSKDLVARARSNKLSLDDLQGGCITVSNLGGFGIDSFIPIVVPGQCSILGIGRITDTCVPVDGNLLTRKLMNLTLSVDHKVANGADAAAFLDFIKKQLEAPAELS